MALLAVALLFDGLINYSISVNVDVLVDAYDRRAAHIDFLHCTSDEFGAHEYQFKLIIANITNEYCSTHWKKCCLPHWHDDFIFDVHSILIAPGYPETKYQFLQVRFVVLYKKLARMVFLSNRDCSFKPRTFEPQVLHNIILDNKGIFTTELGWTVLRDPRKDPIQAVIDIALVPCIVFGLIFMIIGIRFYRRIVRRKEQRDYWEQHRMTVLHQKARRCASLQTCPKVTDAEGATDGAQPIDDNQYVLIEGSLSARHLAPNSSVVPLPPIQQPPESVQAGDRTAHQRRWQEPSRGRLKRLTVAAMAQKGLAAEAGASPREQPLPLKLHTGEASEPTHENEAFRVDDDPV